MPVAIVIDSVLSSACSTAVSSGEPPIQNVPKPSASTSS
jgi:hypothetical protein